MKTLTKKLWVTILTLALIFCTVCGIILTTPSPVRADASTTPYDKELGFEVKEGDNLFGKYVAIFSDGSYSSTPMVGPDGDWDFYVTDEGVPGINVYSTEAGNEITNEVDFDVEYLENSDCYMVVFDFTKEYSFEFDTGNGIVNIVLNEETLNVNKVFSSSVSVPLFFYPKSTYSIKTIEKGDSLANKAIIVPHMQTKEGNWWAIGLTDYSIYFDDFDPGVFFTLFDENEELIQEDLSVTWENDYVYSLYDGYIGCDYLMIEIPETYSLTENGVTYESTLTVTNVEVDGFENNFRVLEFIEDDTPTDTPDVDDGSNEGVSVEEDSAFVKWIVGAWDDVKTFCIENTTAVICGAICLITVIICIAVSVKKKK